VVVNACGLERRRFIKAWEGARQESAAALGMMECILKN
jgi:hypothetical protein